MAQPSKIVYIAKNFTDLKKKKGQSINEFQLRYTVLTY